jgi:CubicO group peptidase (beta-lactamase class C family)
MTLIACCLFMASCGVPEGPVIPEEVQSSIRARVDNGYNIGIVVGMVNTRGETFFSYGRTRLPDGPTPNERTIFEIGSIGKVFTALLLAEMAEQGEVALDDPIERFLPPAVEAPTRKGKSITLLHLASHTSGLPRMADNFDPTDREQPFADYGVEEMYAFLSHHTLRRDIGSRYVYSVIGTGLLGHILSLRAEKPFETLFVERIANILDMPDTRFTLTPDMQRRLAVGYSGPREVSTWPPLPGLQGSGSELSTARDLLTFLAANMGLVETPLGSAMETIQKPHFQTDSPNQEVGLGWHIKTRGQHSIVTHSGGTAGYTCFAGFMPETGTGVVVMSNSSKNVDDIGLHLLDPAIPLLEIQPPYPVAQDVLADYEGTYVAVPPFAPGFTGETHVRVEVLSGWIIAQITDLARVSLYAVSEDRFLSPDTGGTITFIKNEHGEVTGLVGERRGVRQAAEKLGI